MSALPAVGPIPSALLRSATAPPVPPAVPVALQTAGDAAALIDVPRLVGFALASFLVAAVGAAAYRWYVSEPVPRGLTTLLGTATVAVYLNTVGLFTSVIPIAGVELAPATDPFAPATVFRNVLSLLVAAGAAPFGREAGDRFATNVTAVAGADRVEGELSRFARTVGRIRTVGLPEHVVDMEGYDPVDDATKERLAGATLLFPRRLSDAELRDRLVVRLKEEYGVGHVDAELDGDEVTRLGVGRRVAGLGPTLGPGTCAVAVRADPPNGAGPGDVVQVWRLPDAPAPGTGLPAAETDGGPDGTPEGDGHRGQPEPAGGAGASRPAATDGDGEPPRDPERVATAELRAAAGDVVTLAVDESDAGAFDPDGSYRLVTMPAEPRADREFASLLRAADETMGVVTVDERSPLAGRTVGDVRGTVVAVGSESGAVEPIPPSGRPLVGGERVYVVARPEAIREIERRAAAPEPDGGGAVAGAADDPDGRTPERADGDRATDED